MRNKTSNASQRSARIARNMRVLATAKGDGEELPEIPSGYGAKPVGSGSFTSEDESGIMKASLIIEGLLTHAFATAREVAIQTYDRDWFEAETDNGFKTALAKQLAETFGVDGYRNQVWDTVTGTERF